MNGPDAQPKPRHIVIVGGGFSGAALAVQLVRRSRQPLKITIIEGRATLGAGLAYSTTDPDHRLNAPSFSHTLLPDDAWHFARWCREQRALDDDPDALQPDGTAYVRRATFGRYLAATLADHVRWQQTGSNITHQRSTAVHARRLGGRWQIDLQDGTVLTADLLCLATGNAEPRLPPDLEAHSSRLPRLIRNPYDSDILHTVTLTDRVLLLGSGLTAFDTLCTLLRRGHPGPIEVLSRHGLQPAPQGPVAPDLSAALLSRPLEAMPADLLLERVHGPVPDYLARTAEVTPPGRLRPWLMAVHNRISHGLALGESWHTGFDELRDALWQLWPGLTLETRRRFIRRLKPWYDIHRYRAPPPTEQLVRTAVRAGRVRFLTGHLISDGNITFRGTAPHPVATRYDVVINCTGLDAGAGLSRNPLLLSLRNQGFLRPHPCGLGIDTDLDGRAISAQGESLHHLRLIGPPTLGTFGDPIGAIYIGMQVYRLVPRLLDDLTVPVSS